MGIFLITFGVTCMLGGIILSYLDKQISPATIAMVILGWFVFMTGVIVYTDSKGYPNVEMSAKVVYMTTHPGQAPQVELGQSISAQQLKINGVPFIYYEKDKTPYLITEEPNGN